MSDRNNRAPDKAAHNAALGAPQPFPLTGDGNRMASVYDRASGTLRYRGNRLSGTIADSRYLDWLATRDRKAGDGQ